MAKPSTFEDLLANWSTLELKADLAVPYVTARKMREHKSVSISHWPALLKAAQRKGFRLTVDDLVAMKRAA